MEKIILVGANHAGTACANTILDNYGKNVELTIFDRNDNISFLGCGTALWVGKQIPTSDGLFYATKETFINKGAKVHLETEITKIDFAKKTVHAKDKTGKDIEASYDKLILATGSIPIKPNIEGIDLKNVFVAKLFQDAVAINKAMEDESIKKVAVIGAGYIGVELAEAVVRRGKKAMLIDISSTVLSTYYDKEFSKDMDKVLSDFGVELHLEEKVEKINGTDKVKSITTNKSTYDVDMIIMAVGFVPNSNLAYDSIDTLPNRAYKVDLTQETCRTGIYAIGDCASLKYNATGESSYIALATNAVRSGVVAAHNACGTKLESIGVQGSNGISIAGYNMLSTGLTLAAAAKAGIEAMHTDFEDMQKPEFITKDNASVKIRIVYEKGSRRVIGCQMASFYDISMGLHMFSLAIEEGVTIDKLKLLDIFFLPHFNKPYNYITMAALTAK